jgi:hypothetical protein
LKQAKHKSKSEAIKHIPANYKGPISAYNETVSKYFEKRQEFIDLGLVKLDCSPTINQSKSVERTQAIEERLMRIGQEYKSKRSLIRHTVMKEEESEYN